MELVPISLSLEQDCAGISAARLGNEAMLREYLSKGGNPNASDLSGTAMLHYAVAHGQRKIVEFLLESGSNVNAKNSFGDTPLHYCFHLGLHVQKGCLKILLSNPEIKIDQANDRWHTQAHLAALLGSSGALAMLTTKNCDLSMKSNQGLDPQGIADSTNNFGLKQWIQQTSKTRKLQRVRNVLNVRHA